MNNEFFVSVLFFQVRDDQNDELSRKVGKAKTGPVNKDLCNSTRTKAEAVANVANDELMAKVTAYATLPPQISSLFHST